MPACPRLWLPPPSALLFVLAACESYAPAPIDLERAPHERAARRLDAPELRECVARFLAAAPATWPGDTLTLDAAYAIALHHRDETRLARAALAQALAAHAAAAQLDNPRLTAGPGIVTNPGGADRWLATVGLAFPLDLGGRRDAKAQIATSEVTAARVAAARADLAVRADVAERAFADALQQQLAALAAERTTLLDEALAIAERRAARGAADAAECAAARAAAHAAGLERAAAEREQAEARQAFAQALGLPGPELRSLRVGLPGELPFLGDANARADEAARAHLDVAAALADYQRREGELRLAIAAQWPDLELGPGYEYDQGLQKFRLDLGFTLPLFHGAGAAIDAAKAARTHAAAAVAAAQIRGHDDAFAAGGRFAAMPRELAAAQELVDDAAARVADVDRRIARGGADRRDAIAARLDDVAARKALAQLQHDARRAWLACELTAQQPVGNGLLAWQHQDPEGSPWPSAPR